MSLLNLFIRSPLVTTQPSDYDDFENTFNVINDEKIHKLYECQEGCSGCCGPKTTIALTNIRLIIRRQQPNGLFGTTEGGHIDTAIFLRDIELMREAKEKMCSSCGTLFLACITCTWPILLCGLLCGLCCGDTPKTLEVKGAFGSEYLTFNTSNMVNAATEISSMIMLLKENGENH